MTNQEVIEFFKEQQEIFVEGCLMYEAIDIAVKALEKEHTIYIDGYNDGYEEGYVDGFNNATDVNGFNDITDVWNDYRSKCE